MISSLIITNDAAARCARGERWLSARDVVGRRPTFPGIATILDRRRRFVAMAFSSPGSRCFLRVITTSEEAIDRAFWRRRVRRAFERREGLAPTTNAFRVVHAEADGIPGVVIDKYNDVWAIQVSAAGAETVAGDLCEIIVQDFGPAALVEKNDIPVRREEGLPTAQRLAWGTKGRSLVREGDQRFDVDVLAGQKTGAYLDYRAFRLRARAFARGRCLDAFSYQGWFSCQIAPRADAVVAVDASADAVAAARENALRNGHANIECVRADAFEYLQGCSETFSFIHLDPPPFAKGRASLGAAIAGYRRLLKEAWRLLDSRGVLMVSACSHAITERILEEVVLTSMARAGRSGEVVFRGIQDVDHPVLRGFPESLYLKAIAVRGFDR